MSLFSEILDQKKASFDSLKTKRLMWDTVEKLFHGQLADQISKETNNEVVDHALSTLIIERGYRVMSQLPTGKVKAISKNDLGAAKLMGLEMDKYVIPNANAQFDFLTKLRMVDIYSSLYGSFSVLIDNDVKRNGYVGPDMWLLNKRDVFPVVGNVSYDDSDEIIVRTWQPLSYFEKLRGQKEYKNINTIIEKLSKKTGSKQDRDSENNSKRNEKLYSEDSPARKQGFFEVLSRFERDRWVDVVVDAETEFRDQKNPHDDGELPVVTKYSIPLLDDIDGIGDAERGMSMQNLKNSIWNLYLQGVRMSIFPPIALDKDSIASESSIKYMQAAKWLFRGPVGNAMQPVNISPQGIQTFNNVHQVASGSLLNLFGTTDTAVTQQQDPGYGKTPQALKMQQQRENTRDNADRFYMEQFLKKAMKKMVNLMSKNQNDTVSIRMFSDEIDQIARDYPEIKEMYDENTGKLNIDKSKTGSIMYDYEIVSGSTYALDQQAQQENLQQLLSLYQNSQTPQGNLLVRDLDQSGFKFNFGELFKRVVSSSGIQDWDKILIEKTEQEKSESVLSNDAQVFQNIIGQMQAGQGGASVPPQPMAPQPQVPAQPDMGGVV